MASKLFGIAKVRNTNKNAWCLQWNMLVAVSLCGAAWVLLVSGSCISLMALWIHKRTALYWKRRCYHHSVPLVVMHFSNMTMILHTLEVFTEDPRPEDPGPDPGPVRVRVYILNGQPGPGRVPIYYFGSRVCLTLCVIPESIREHRTCQWSVSVGTLCVFCNLQLVKLNWKWTEMNCHINVVYEVYIALQ